MSQAVILKSVEKKGIHAGNVDSIAKLFIVTEHFRRHDQTPNPDIKVHKKKPVARQHIVLE